MCQIFVIQISFQSSERVDPDSCIYVSEILFSLNSQGNEKHELFSQRTYDFHSFGNETLFNADHENVKKSAFDLLAAKLWLKETTIFWKICTFR